MTHSNRYIFFDKESEFTKKVLSLFAKRLQLYLGHTFTTPRIIFTKSNTTLLKEVHYTFDDANAIMHYDETDECVIFDASRFKIGTDSFYYKSRDIESSNKYCVFYGDIFHELIHHIQYTLSDYSVTPIVEASSEILSTILTDDYQMGY